MRSRNIKPGILKNEILGTEDPIYTLLFEGLWMLADREGVLEDRPIRIKGEVFPYRSVDVNALLIKLVQWGFIHRYRSDGVPLIYIPNFKKHQTPHHTERAGEFPKPKDAENIDGCDITVNSPLEHGENPPDSLIPDSLIQEVLPPPPPEGGKPVGGGKPKRLPRSPNGYVTPPEIHPKLRRLAAWLASNWPKESWGMQGDRRRVQRYSEADLWARCCEVGARCGVEPGALLFCGESYLLRILEEAKDTGKPKYVKDMSNFFGIKYETRGWSESYASSLVEYKKHMGVQ